MRVSLVVRNSVLFKHANHVGVLTLNVPEKYNALSVAVGEEFQRVVRDEVVHAPIRALVLTGAGKAFSAGGDLDFLLARKNETPSANSDEMLRYYDRFLSLRRLVNVPTIAAINGPAVGAGMCLAMTCDMRVVSSQARMGVNFSRLGIHAGLGSTHYLPKLLGNQAASYLLLTGKLIDGVDAVRLGVALEAVDDALARAMEIALEVAEASPVACQATLKTLRKNQDEGLPLALQREADSQAHCYAHPDLQEGLSAIKEKRTPKFL